MSNHFEKLTFFIDGNCPFCRWGARVFQRALGLQSEAEIRYSSTDPVMHHLMREKNSWILRTRTGSLYFGFAAITYAFYKSPRRWLRRLVPFMRLRLVQRVGEAFYHLVTVSRPLLSKLVPA
ncbi:MAG: DUF393 domain-containing protein [Acidobacteriales bacterium]|nr:DUF393 domain-containing protein [Terriglobales bacterium]